MKYPCFIDFEASGFGETSYPIEVAWNDEEGQTFCHLINRTMVKNWTHWDKKSEYNAHRISRTELAEKGMDPAEVCAIMNSGLNGKTLYCDAPAHDGFWLMRLFNATGMLPTFQLGSALDLFYQRIDTEQKGHRTTRDTFNMMQDTLGLQAWENIGLPPHRAEPDVRYLMEMYRLLMKNHGKIY